MSNTSKVVKAKLEGGRLLRMEVSSVDEARFIADKLVWQRFEVNEVFWTGPFGVNMLYTIANHFEYVRMVTITPLPAQINPWTITRGKHVQLVMGIQKRCRAIVRFTYVIT